MGLVAQKDSHEGHDKHAGHSVSMFKNKFWLSLLMSVPVLAYSESIQEWLRFSSPEFVGSTYIPFIFSTAIFFYGGMVFLKSAKSEIAARMPGMMTLISLAIITAYSYSVATLFFISGDGFFWELASLVTIMLLGHWLEMASVMKAESALDAIIELLPDKAEKLVKGKPKEVLVSELKVGDFVLVRPGSSIPVDGVISEGETSINEAAITGESVPVTKVVDDLVIAGTVNQDGAITIKVTKLGDDTALAGIMKLVKEAQESKSNIQLLADKAAFALTIVAIATSILTFIYWYFTKDTSFAVERAITVLIIACPHALGLAIPLVVSISSALSARNGLLVRNRLAMESARNIDIVLFDKTGTLTKGEHGVTDIWAEEDFTKEDVLQLTASLEQKSEHIVGRGIVSYSEDKKTKLFKVSDFSAIPGQGVTGTLPGMGKFVAASKRFVVEHKSEMSKKLASQTSAAAKKGNTEVFLINSKNVVVGAIALADQIRPEAKSAIKAFKKLGIKTAMVTGDSQKVAELVSKQLGIDQYFAEVKPEDKSKQVKKLQDQGLRVAMVGDGINDAPALARADIGIAIGAGTDVALKSADIILVNSNPLDVVKVVRLSKATYTKMVQNLFWGAGYNVLAIPLAAGVLYGYGIVMAPAIGAVFMSASTIIVAFNAQLLRNANISS
jgi:Cu2+-exporting ATPase